MEHLAPDASIASTVQQPPTLPVDSKKVEQLTNLLSYQTAYMNSHLKIESKKARDKLENDLCRLMEYSSQLTDENQLMQMEINEFSKLKLEHEAEQQATELNKLRDMPMIVGYLKELKDSLCGTSNYLKGITDSSVTDVSEWAEKLHSTVDIMDQQFENLINANKCNISKSAEGCKRLATLFNEQHSLLSEIRTVLNEIMLLAIEVQYQEASKRLNLT